MLIENRKERIGEFVEKVDIAGRKRQLSMNAKKTKSMTLGGNKAEIKVGDEKVEEVEHFKYLGSVKTVDGNSTKDVKIRIGMAKAKTNKLVNIWKDRSIPTVLKVKLVGP